jgi:hypothetical protein
LKSKRGNEGAFCTLCKHFFSRQTVAYSRTSLYRTRLYRIPGYFEVVPTSRPTAIVINRLFPRLYRTRLYRNFGYFEYALRSHASARTGYIEVTECRLNRDKIFATYDDTNPSRKRQRSSAYADVEEALLRWFTQARAKGVAVSGPILTMQAWKFADALGFADFQGSSGWLDRFKQRHGITGKCITGESAAVSEDMTSEWVTSSLPRILKQYAPKDIYNMDETGIFFRLTPDKTLTFKGDSCHGGKRIERAYNSGSVCKYGRI